MVCIIIIIMKKIFINDIKINDLKKNIISYLRNEYTFKTILEHIILSQNEYYKYNNNELYKFSIHHEHLNETEYFTEILENEIKKYKVMQIPIKHTFICKKKVTFDLKNKCYLVFELINDKINDFYITSTMKLNIHDFILHKELSHIKNLLI